MNKSFFKLFLAGFVAVFFTACTVSVEPVDSDDSSSSSVAESSSANEKSIYEAVEESGLYTTRNSVAA